jgi:hypothetical protein
MHCMALPALASELVQHLAAICVRIEMSVAESAEHTEDMGFAYDSSGKPENIPRRTPPFLLRSMCNAVVSLRKCDIVT